MEGVVVKKNKKLRVMCHYRRRLDDHIIILDEDQAAHIDAALFYQLIFPVPQLSNRSRLLLGSCEGNKNSYSQLHNFKDEYRKLWFKMEKKEWLIRWFKTPK
jgi:hypothetical protein